MFKNSMALISKLILIITFSLVISYSTQSIESNDEETRDKTAVRLFIIFKRIILSTSNYC